ncbi:MAG: DHH family phosphoesterase, partial [Oscillospiraceae bacterium]
VEYEISQYAKEYEALICKTERDKFTIIIREEQLKKAIDNKFAILDTVRSISIGERMTATLSIGAARDGKDIREVEQCARQALDMALGRGGDQAALKTQNGYDFYGGISKGVEKRTKVKSRIVATALAELMESCENIIIMGHRFADLDCFGAAIGLSKVAEQMGKPVNIAIRSQKHLVSPLYEQLYENGYNKIFSEPEELLNTVNANTLLIVVDTHVENILECPELYKACKHVVVIDHHRKMVGHIGNAVIFYHEPYASSTCEMVSELIQYFGDYGKLSRLEAEALLAGIMLDTKNFIIKTGVRTFEAAAYLKKMGADTVDVKKLFSSPIATYQNRSALVSSAEIYKNCAIATADEASADIKIIVPQAADELLNIQGVDASFVMYEMNNEVSFSARSMGKINVQLIMEKLSGGGHLTMAGAQVKNISLSEAKKMLTDAIDKYLEEKSQ